MIYEIIRNISWPLPLISFLFCPSFLIQTPKTLYVRVPVESHVLVFYLDIELL